MITIAQGASQVAETCLHQSFSTVYSQHNNMLTITLLACYLTTDIFTKRYEEVYEDQLKTSQTPQSETTGGCCRGGGDERTDSNTDTSSCGIYRGRAAQIDC